jgi:CRISPR/Cas system CSM-associated protein Csm5 (group 7 of RAMP superfamily)
MSNWNDAISDLLDQFLSAENRERLEWQAEKEAKERKLLAKKNKDDAKAKLVSMLEEAGVTSEHHPRALLTLSEGRETLAIDPNVDPEKFPIDLVKIKKELNKPELQKALIRGASFEGVEIKRGAPILRIKMKESV